MYNSMMDYYYPILWYSFIDTILLEKVGADSELGIDQYFLEQAYEDDKEILDIESMAIQFEMLSGFSEELQNILLESSVVQYENIEGSEEELNNMIALWASGDESIGDTAQEELAFTLMGKKELYEEYKNALIVERNISMADFAEDTLESGEEVFICVGAAHVVGEGAMADLLEERGYTVELVS